MDPAMTAPIHELQSRLAGKHHEDLRIAMSIVAEVGYAKCNLFCGDTEADTWVTSRSSKILDLSPSFPRERTSRILLYIDKLQSMLECDAR